MTAATLPDTMAAALFALANTREVRALPADQRANLVEACQRFLNVHEADERRAVERQARPWCSHCDHPDAMPCEAVGPCGYACTRAIGHEGNHVACGREHSIAIWGPEPISAAEQRQAREVVEVRTDGSRRVIKSNSGAS